METPLSFAEQDVRNSIETERQRGIMFSNIARFFEVLITLCNVGIQFALDAEQEKKETRNNNPTRRTH